MGITTAFIWLQTAIMIMFAKNVLPDNMSHIWKGLFGEPTPTPTARQIKERQESDRIARKVAFDQALEWRNECITKHSQRRR